MIEPEDNTIIQQTITIPMISRALGLALVIGQGEVCEL
jgi:hypothetical protein